MPLVKNESSPLKEMLAELICQQVCQQESNRPFSETIFLEELYTVDQLRWLIGKCYIAAMPECNEVRWNVQKLREHLYILMES